MENKLLDLINDLNDYSYDLYGIHENFLEDSIVFCSTGYDEVIKFMGSRIYYDGIWDYKQILIEVKEKAEKWNKLCELMEKFFSNMSNEEIEEKYEIGTEEDKEVT